MIHILEYVASKSSLVDGIAAFIGALIVGLIILLLYRVVGSRFLGGWLIPAFRTIDKFLVERVAPITGVTKPKAWLRWLVFMCWFLGLSLVAMLAPYWFGMGATLLGIFFVLAIYRAWEADEEERRLKEDMNEVAPAGNDLGNEILLGLAFLVVFFTLGFSRLSEVEPIYNGVPNVPFAQSAAFVGGEFLKAVPIVDASEVFGWNNVSGLNAQGITGQTMNFILRVFLDLILLAAIIRLLSIVRRRAEGADLRDIRELLASEDESEIISGIARLEDLSLRNRLNAQRELERIALREYENLRLLRNPEVLVAAAVSLQKLTDKYGAQKFVLVGVEAYKAALEVYTREAMPSDWAGTQNNLGNALQTLGKIAGDTGRLEEAVSAYRAALEVYTREAMSSDWASTQNNLGSVLLTLGEIAGDPGRLEDAVNAFQAALEVYTREAMPSDWALTQHNLGTALRALGETVGDKGLLEEAVNVCRSALEVRTREATPSDWAGTQNNLGTALGALGKTVGDAGLLEEAVSAFRSALEVYTREAMPSNWANTQHNVGYSLGILSGISVDTRRMEEAVSAFRSALEVYTREAMPSNWAKTQIALGLALQTLGEIARDTGRLEEAIGLWEQVADFYTSTENSQTLEKIASSIGLARKLIVSMQSS